MVIIGVAVLGDHNSPRIFPRWVALFNFWSALLIFPAGLIAFFKTGPFAYDGAISFWSAFAVFFGWMVGMTVVAFRAVAVEERRQLGRAPPIGARRLPAEQRMCSETVPEASHLPGEEGVWLFVIGVMVMFTALFAIFFHYARSIRPSSRARTGRSIKGWA